jgi:hypothetical protein
MFIKHYKDSYFKEDYSNMTYFGGGSLNKYIHNNTL